MNQRGFVWLPLLPYIIGAVAFVGLAAWAYQYVDNNWATDAGIKKGRAEVQAKWDQAALEQRQAEEKRISEAATVKENGDAKAKVVYRTITKAVDRIVVEYRDRACLDPDGVRAASDALRGPSAPAGEPDKPMPQSDRAGGRTGGDSTPQAR